MAQPYGSCHEPCMGEAERSHPRDEDTVVVPEEPYSKSGFNQVFILDLVKSIDSLVSFTLESFSV